jgi:lysophospholipase L1-like esterase
MFRCNQQSLTANDPLGGGKMKTLPLIPKEGENIRGVLLTKHNEPRSSYDASVKGVGSFHRLFPVLVASCIVFGPGNISAQAKKWVGTWSTAEQLVETANNPPSPGLTSNTLRQIVCVSIGGDTLRLRFSNKFSTSAVTINSATIAVSTGRSAITTSTLKQLKFSGSASITMNAGDSAVYSDPLAFGLTPRMKLAISIYFGQTSSSVTGHPGSRTTSYLNSGKQDTAASFSVVDTASHWYVINTIDVWTSNSSAAAVAILGNSITDGRGSTPDSQNRWPDMLSQRLINNTPTQNVGVLNLGIGANCVLSTCTGPSGVDRYHRDILDQQGVKWVIIFEGVNDIGSVTTSSGATTTATNLINAYKNMITAAHAQSLKIYGATIMAFHGNSYYNQYSESCRQTVNKWVRDSGYFDAVIDFDKYTRSKTDTTKLGIASYQNDSLHPTAAGYKLMADSIDLNLFVQSTGTLNGTADNKDHAGVKLRANHCHGTAMLTFEIPHEAFVSLKIYSMLGKEIAELAGRKFSSGRHTVEFNSGNLAKGIYVYSLKVDKVSINRKMIY